MPGREGDARVEAIAFRLATGGIARCQHRRADWGLVLQHLGQFELPDRAALAASQLLDRGPEVIAVVPGGPAAAADIRPGDVVLAIDGHPLPPEPDLGLPFNRVRALDRLDRIDALTAEPMAPRRVEILRAGRRLDRLVSPRAACAVQVRLARSNQRNAFADARHATVTTGLLARLGGDDQVAFVVAHEMAHLILEHAAAMRAGGADQRELERAADALGIELLRDAGYDPIAGAEALRSSGGLHVSLSVSHDGAAERIEAVRRLAGRPPAP